MEGDNQLDDCGYGIRVDGKKVCLLCASTKAEETHPCCENESKSDAILGRAVARMV